MFKIKKSTRLKKVFAAYAARKGVEASASESFCSSITCVSFCFLNPSEVRFMLDGENIEPDSTPGDLDLEDNDQIDCFLAQVGGK